MSVTLINAKHQDILQNIYTGLYQKIVDISDISGINTICSKETVARITQRFEIISDSTVHFLGNGNFHYLTLPLLKKYTHPFTLIVFDHHNDAGELGFEGFTSCGSWINEVVRGLPMVQKIVLMGVGEEHGKEMIDLHKDLIEIISENKLDYLTDLVNNHMIPTEDIYISIDRDILSETEVQTNWNQGTVSVEQLKKAIQLVSQKHRVIGADVCGDLDWDYSLLQQMEMKKAKHQAYQVNKELFQLLESLVKWEYPTEQSFLLF